MKKTLNSRPRSDFSNLSSGFNLAKSLATILLGASLFFGAGNKTKAQCECQAYNHDADEFSEEKICWRKDGFNETTKKYKQSQMGLTIISYSDKDNDNFYESIRIFNCNKMNQVSLENFYIDKNTGLINYDWKFYNTSPLGWKEAYNQKTPWEIITENFPFKYKYNCIANQSLYNLTIEQIYSIHPGSWLFYGGFGERTKKLINAGKNLDEIKKMVNDERNLWGYELK